MTPVTHPHKQVVRDYLTGRARQESPPPEIEEIRRQLGWRLVPENGPAPEVPD